MSKKMIGLLILLCILAACSHGKTVDDFNFLEKGMRYQDVYTGGSIEISVNRVGKADQETGSGVYAYTYELSNGNSVVLIFLQLDSLYSAHLVDASGDLR